MIIYDDGFWGLGSLWKLHGSVIWKACAWSFSSAAITVVLHYYIHKDANYSFMQDFIRNDTGMLHGFTVVFGFALTFRTSQAHARFVEGATTMHKMRGEWFNSFSSLMAFCSADPQKEKIVRKFQHRMARLISLLHATAIQQLSAKGVHHLDIFDLNGFDVESMKYLEGAHDRVEVVLQWIQKIIVEAEIDGALKIAPPILSRVYNQLGNGIVMLNQCRTIVEVQIPFPFVQCLTAMLTLQFFLTPILIASAVTSALWAGFDCFLIITCFWSLNYIAMELENPFGTDANDFPSKKLQQELNKSLAGLLQKRALTPPAFDFDDVSQTEICVHHTNVGAIVQCMEEMRRFSKDYGRHLDHGPHDQPPDQILDVEGIGNSSDRPSSGNTSGVLAKGIGNPKTTHFIIVDLPIVEDRTKEAKENMANTETKSLRVAPDVGARSVLDTDIEQALRSALDTDQGLRAVLDKAQTLRTPLGADQGMETPERICDATVERSRFPPPVTDTLESRQWC